MYQHLPVELEAISAICADFGAHCASCENFPKCFPQFSESRLIYVKTFVCFAYKGHYENH